MGRTIGSRVAVFSLLLLGGAPSAWAYVQTVTPAGIPVQWRSGFKFNVAGNARNASGLSDGDVHRAISRSLQRWQSASNGTAGFDYWQGSDDSVYEPDSEYNGLSSVYFASHSRGGDGVSANVLGLTQVWYNADTGQILEADTVLNDRDFIFTTDPRDTSGYGAGGANFASGRTRVYIENVLTHEFGHSLGLSHSAGLQSTMLFMESPEQAHLGCDEQIGIHALYPGGDAGARGWLTGVVTTQSGRPVFGAHVLAVSRSRGAVLSSGITDRAGTYSISGLEPGPYYVIVEPYLAGPSALPSYYGSMNTDVCSGGEPFRRTVLTDSSGYLAQVVNVPRGGRGAAPALRVNCTPQGDAISSNRSSASLSSAPPIYDGSDPSGFGVVDRFERTHQTYYSLTGVSGRLEIHGLAYSVYSPVHASLSLEDANGNPVAAQTYDRVYQGDSGYVNYDTELVVENLPRGNYVLRVSTTSIGVTYYPAGPVMLDSDPYLLIMGKVNAPQPAMAASIPDNARCRMNESFAAYQSPPGDPPRADVDDSSALGFCGTTQSHGGGKGPGAGDIAGWFLPWVLMAGIVRAMARFQRRPRRAFSRRVLS